MVIRCQKYPMQCEKTHIVRGLFDKQIKKYRIVYSEMCLHKCPQLLFSQEEKTVMKRGVLLANDTEQVEIPMQK